MFTWSNEHAYDLHVPNVILAEDPIILVELACSLVNVIFKKKKGLFIQKI